MKICHQVSGSSFSLCVSGCEIGVSAVAGDSRTHCWPCAGTSCRDLQGWGQNVPQRHWFKSTHYRSALQMAETCLCSWLWSLLPTLGMFWRVLETMFKVRWSEKSRFDRGNKPPKLEIFSFKLSQNINDSNHKWDRQCIRIKFACFNMAKNATPVK